jgi:hypothetical protein
MVALKVVCHFESGDLILQPRGIVARSFTGSRLESVPWHRSDVAKFRRVPGDNYLKQLLPLTNKFMLHSRDPEKHYRPCHLKSVSSLPSPPLQKDLTPLRSASLVN